MSEPKSVTEGTFQIEMIEGMGIPAVVESFAQAGLATMAAMRQVAEENDDRRLVARIILVSEMLKDHFATMVEGLDDNSDANGASDLLDRTSGPDLPFSGMSAE